MDGGTVSVFLGDGDGTFEPRQDYGTRFVDLYELALADLNGDRKPDIVAAGLRRAEEVLVLLNNGNGTFRNARRYNGGGLLAVDDLSRDGRPDLVTLRVAIGTREAVSVRLNRGDGSFGSPRNSVLATGEYVSGGKIADLNNDGKPDLVTFDDDPINPTPIGLSVFLNHGPGTFGRRRDYPAWRTLHSLAIGDVNGDSRPDLVASDWPSSVSVFLNTGHGRFQWPRHYPTVGRPHRGDDCCPGPLVVRDLNGDGRSDLLAVNSESFAVLLNRPGLCNVQDVIGLKPARARWALARVNCRAVVHRVLDPRHRWPKGYVVHSQKPGYGAVLLAGGRVRVTVRFVRRARGCGC